MLVKTTLVPGAETARPALALQGRLPLRHVGVYAREARRVRGSDPWSCLRTVVIAEVDRRRLAGPTQGDEPWISRQV